MLIQWLYRGASTATIHLDLTDELLELLERSKLSGRDISERVRLALATQLFQEGIISIGKAASLCGEPRATFELLLGCIGIPPVRYDMQDYEQDRAAFDRVGGKAAFAEFTRLAARAAAEADNPELTDQEIVESAKQIRAKLYSERYGKPE